MKRRTVKRIPSPPPCGLPRAAFVASCASAAVCFLPRLGRGSGRAIDNILGLGRWTCAAYCTIWRCYLGAAGRSQWVMNVCTFARFPAGRPTICAAKHSRAEPHAAEARSTATRTATLSRMVNDADLVAEGLLQGSDTFLPEWLTFWASLVVMAVELCHRAGRGFR